MSRKVIPGSTKANPSIMAEQNDTKRDLITNRVAYASQMKDYWTIELKRLLETSESNEVIPYQKDKI